MSRDLQFYASSEQGHKAGMGLEGINYDRLIDNAPKGMPWALP